MFGIIKMTKMKFIHKQYYTTNYQHNTHSLSKNWCNSFLKAMKNELIHEYRQIGKEKMKIKMFQ